MNTILRNIQKIALQLKTQIGGRENEWYVFFLSFRDLTASLEK